MSQRIRPAAPRVELESVKRRLEIVLAATYNRSIPVSELPDLRPPRGVKRWIATVQRMRRPSLSTHDDSGVLLPVSMPASMTYDDAISHYRLLAMEQAERLVRGTAALNTDDALVRDLYLLREAQAVDSTIARENVGLRAPLAAARQRALGERGTMDRMTIQEQQVEQLLRATLARGGMDADVASPAASLEWAKVKAHEIRRLPGKYRSIGGVSLWGAPSKAATPIDPAAVAEATAMQQSGLIPLAGLAASSPPPQSDGKVGFTDAPSSNDIPPEEPPDDVQLPIGRAQQAGEHDALLQQDGGGDDDAEGLPTGITYPEWDAGTGRYRADGVTVRVTESEETDSAWAVSALASRASLLKRVQQQFERLRARRTRLVQQRRGDDIDLTAVVRAIADRRAGLAPDDRLYTDVRPARRGLAIALLVDVSGSTDLQVTHAMQIIDIEKIAVLLASNAFDALGDPYTVLSFTGRGAADVRIKTVKAFDERSGEVFRRRVSALRPEGSTRMGAAIRHASALLVRQPAGHRLLLMLSDGRPNDIEYMDTYAVEDSRQAILEARAQGIFPFCLTVDRDGAEYLPHIFGAAGHVIIRNPEGLPHALLRAVRQLLRFS